MRALFQQNDDIDTLVDKWSTFWALIIEKYSPLREMPVSEKYCLWINKDLKSLKLTKDELKKAALSSKSTILIDSRRQAQNRVNCVNSNLSLERKSF